MLCTNQIPASFEKQSSQQQEINEQLCFEWHTLAVQIKSVRLRFEFLLHSFRKKAVEKICDGIYISGGFTIEGNILWINEFSDQLSLLSSPQCCVLLKDSHWSHCTPFHCRVHKSRCPASTSPVETQSADTLLDWPVDRVHPGAGIHLLPAVCTAHKTHSGSVLLCWRDYSWSKVDVHGSLTGRQRPCRCRRGC